MAVQLFLNGLISGSIYALIALGFSIIYKTVRFFHFAHGIVYTLGAYLAYTFTSYLSLNFFLAFVLSVSLTILLGMGIEKFVYAPLRKRRAPNLALLLASFGVFIAMENLIALFYGNRILTLRSGAVEEGYRFLGARITPTQVVIIVVSVGLTIICWQLIKRTKFGKALRAVSDDPFSASVVGINPQKITLGAFAIGSALAGVAGILVALETNIEPSMGLPAILKGIIASIVGGIGSIPGAMLGGLLLGLAENLGIWHIQASWKDAIAFGVLIVFLLLRPSGILGMKRARGRI